MSIVVGSLFVKYSFSRRENTLLKQLLTLVQCSPSFLVVSDVKLVQDTCYLRVIRALKGYFDQVSRRVTVLLNTGFCELCSNRSATKYPSRSN